MNIFEALNTILDMCSKELYETIETLMSWGEASIDGATVTFGDMHVAFWKDGEVLATFSDQDRLDWQRHYDMEQVA